MHEFQRLIDLRKERPAVRRGEFHFLWAADSVVAYARRFHDETVVVALNASRYSRRLDLPLGNLVPDETVWVECWTHDTARVEQGMLRNLTLAPRSGRVFTTLP